MYSNVNCQFYICLLFGYDILLHVKFVYLIQKNTETAKPSNVLVLEISVRT